MAALSLPRDHLEIVSEVTKNGFNAAMNVETATENQKWSLLLALPPEVWVVILSFDSLQSEALWLWTTGCRALQDTIEKYTTKIDFESNKWSYKYRPNILPKFGRLRELNITCNISHRAKHVPHISSLLKQCPNTLRKLQIRLEYQNPTASKNKSSTAYFNAQGLINLRELFPNLETLELDLHRELSTFSLPDTLTHLRAVGPSSALSSPLWSQNLPRGLTKWTGKAVGLDISVEALSGFPQGLQQLGIAIDSPQTDTLAALPRGLTTLQLLGEYVYMSPKLALLLPRSLTDLEIQSNGYGAAEIIESLPPGLKRLVWTPRPEHSIPLSCKAIQSLPRDLLELSASVNVSYDLEETTFPNLTSLKVTSGTYSLDDLSLLAVFSPLTLRTLWLPKSTKAFEDIFFTVLPERLTDLRCSMDNVIDIKDRIFPSKLTSLGWPTSPSSIETPSEALEIPLSTFPFHKLPNTLTELYLDTLAFPMAQLHHLPPLNVLEVLCFTDDGFDSKSEVLIARAQALQHYGLPHDQRSHSPQRTLESVGLFDLLPKTLKRLYVRWSNDLIYGNSPELAAFPFLQMAISRHEKARIEIPLLVKSKKTP